MHNANPWRGPWPHFPAPILATKPTPRASMRPRHVAPLATSETRQGMAARHAHACRKTPAHGRTIAPRADSKRAHAHPGRNCPRACRAHNARFARHAWRIPGACRFNTGGPVPAHIAPPGQWRTRARLPAHGQKKPGENPGQCQIISILHVRAPRRSLSPSH